MINFEEPVLDKVLTGLKHYISSDLPVSEKNVFDEAEHGGKVLVIDPILKVLSYGTELANAISRPARIDLKCDIVRENDLDYKFLKSVLACWFIYTGKRNEELIKLVKEDIVENYTTEKYETFEEEFYGYIMRSIESGILKIPMSKTMNLNTIYNYMKKHHLTTLVDKDGVTYIGDFITESIIFLSDNLLDDLFEIRTMDSLTRCKVSINETNGVRADKLLLSLFLVGIRILTRVRGHEDLEGSFLAYYDEFIKKSIYDMI